MSADKLFLIEHALASGGTLPPELCDFLVNALRLWRAGECLETVLLGNGKIAQRDEWLRVAADCLDLPPGCSDWQRAQALAAAIQRSKHLSSPRTDAQIAIAVAGRLGRLPETARRLWSILTGG